MKKIAKNWIYSLAVMGVFLMIISGCKKEDERNDPTPTDETVTDIDGNVYHTVTIGTQVWMVENLKTTKFNDGTPIDLVTDDAAWLDLTTPGYCWYENEEATYKNAYGALYNWYAVNTYKLAPAGWHVPTDSEWSRLIHYLGGYAIAGDKMKSTGTMEAGTGLWHYPNRGATNESGFSAVPAGGRFGDGAFGHGMSMGGWWSSTEGITGTTGNYYLSSECSGVNTMNWGRDCGFSVRCLRDF